MQRATRALDANPHLLFHPETRFFREFLAEAAAAAPAPTAEEIRALTDAVAAMRADPALRDRLSVRVELGEAAAANASVGSLEEDSSEEEEVEVPQVPGVEALTPESEEPPSPPSTGELLEEDRRADLLAEASAAVQQGEYSTALDLMTTALSLGGATAMIIARRADVLLKLRRPIAAIADCDFALSLNPNSVRALRVRGMAQAAMGEWELAAHDLHAAQSIDFDADCEDLTKRVAAQWNAVRTARAARETRRAERRARNAARDAARNVAGASGMPKMPAGFTMDQLLGKVMGNPKVMQAMQNPKVMNAMTDAMSNPANMSKYMNDPEIMDAFKSIMGAMG